MAVDKGSLTCCMHAVSKRHRSIFLVPKVKGSRKALTFILGYIINFLRDYLYIARHYLITTGKVFLMGHLASSYFKGGWWLKDQSILVVS